MNTWWSRLQSIVRWMWGVSAWQPKAPSSVPRVTTTAVRDAAEVAEFEAIGGRGQRFEPTVERELDADLRTLASGLPGAGEGLLAVVEFHGPRGVPDLLVMARGVAALRHRLENGAPFIESPADCAVVAVLNIKRPMTSSSVASETGMSLEQVERRLRALTHAGIVVTQGQGYCRRADIEPIGRTYAFEAKVSDWRRGLDQALRYSAWCDASSLVLLRAPADMGGLIERCTLFDIGLAIRDEWVRRPRLGRPQPALRLAASERLALQVSHLELKPFTPSVGV